MKFSKKRLLLAGAVWTAIGLSPVAEAEAGLPAEASAEAGPWQAGAGFYTTSGDYGTDSETTTVYIPFSVRRNFEPAHLELVVPFLSVTTQGNVVIIGGRPNGKGQQQKVEEESHGGLGDMVLRGSYYMVEETDKLPAIDLIGRIKIPTASASEGLGTGHFDETAGVEFSKTFQKRILALADVGYTLIGGEAYRNQWYYSLGGGYYFIPEKWSGTLSYEERRSLFKGESNPKDLLFHTEYKATDRIRVHGALELGVSSTAPDVGLFFGGRYSF